MGFNAATAMRPWRTRALTARYLLTLELQCGHGHEAVENGGRHVEFGVALHDASMRPRP